MGYTFISPAILVEERKTKMEGRSALFNISDLHPHPEGRPRLIPTFRDGTQEWFNWTRTLTVKKRRRKKAFSSLGLTCVLCFKWDQ